MTISIVGTVMDENGRPIVDAEVKTVGRSGTRTRTDVAGRFLIPEINECHDYLLKASRGGFAPEFLSVTPCGTVAEYRLTLRPGTVGFGTVVDESGRPVGGAWIGLFPYWSDFSVLASTQVADHDWYRSSSRADGSFQIPDLPAGKFDLRVWHRDFPLLNGGSIEVSRESRRTDLGRFVLTTGQRFKGRVLDPKGRPLSGVQVWTLDSLLQWNPNSDPLPGSAELTARDGSFAVPFITRLGFCLPGYQYSEIAAVPPQPRKIVLTPAVPLPRISGRVLDETGRPIAGARVAREDPGLLEPAEWKPCPKKQPIAAITDVAGRFAFALADAHDFDLRAEAPGYLREIRKITSGKVAGRLEIVLRNEATVAGRVFAPDGLPVAGARVYATQDGETPQTVTDAQGRYRLAAIVPGLRNVWADHPDHGESRRRLELVPGANRLDLTLDGQREHAIAGRVVGPGGEPLAGVLVQTGNSSFYSHDDGSFRVVFSRGSLLHLTTESLNLSLEGYAPLTLAFKPADIPIEGLEIPLEKGRSITGHILGVEPEQIAKVLIQARRLDFWRDGQVSPGGSYRIDDLRPGAWSIEASVAGRRAQKRVEIGAGEASLDLELPWLKEVRGRVLGPDGSPVSTHVYFQRDPSDAHEVYSATTGEDGAFSLEVPPGSYTVSASAGQCADGHLEKRLTLLGSPSEDLELRLEPGLGPVLRGRILGLPRGVDVREDVNLLISQANGRVRMPLEPDGTYRCASLEPGEWTVEAGLSTDGPLEASAESRITLPPGAAETIVDLDISQGTLTLSGHLTSGNEPLFANVTLLRDGKDYGFDVIDDREGGNFRFPGLHAGTYLLQIKDYDRDRIVERSIDLTADETVTIDLLQRK